MSAVNDLESVWEMNTSPHCFVLMIWVKGPQVQIVATCIKMYVCHSDQRLKTTDMLHPLKEKKKKEKKMLAFFSTSWFIIYEWLCFFSNNWKPWWLICFHLWCQQFVTMSPACVYTGKKERKEKKPKRLPCVFALAHVVILRVMCVSGWENCLICLFMWNCNRDWCCHLPL